MTSLTRQEAMAAVRIELPFPPSELTPHAKGNWRKKAAATKRYRQLIADEAKRIRGDDYYLRQPDDPGVDPADPIESRSSDWRLIIGLFALQLAIIGVFVWMVMG